MVRPAAAAACLPVAPREPPRFDGPALADPAPRGVAFVVRDDLAVPALLPDAVVVAPERRDVVLAPVFLLAADRAADFAADLAADFAAAADPAARPPAFAPAVRLVVAVR
ncbi:MAG: hypothetical protein ACRDYU_17635 [Actinomycetes bacterium]